MLVQVCDRGQQSSPRNTTTFHYSGGYALAVSCHLLQKLIRFWTNNNGSITKSKDLLPSPELLQQPGIHISNALSRCCCKARAEGYGWYG